MLRESVNEHTLSLEDLAGAMVSMLDFFADQAEAASQLYEARRKQAGALWTPGQGKPS